jgi:hypothetical protein
MKKRNKRKKKNKFPPLKRYIKKYTTENMGEIAVFDLGVIAWMMI